MKRTLLFITLLFTALSIKAQSNLNPGDIAIIGFNEDAGPGAGKDHSFTWIALTDIPANQEIYFSEEGWNDNLSDTPQGFWNGSEGHFKWTAPAGGLGCGTVVHIYESGADVFTVQGGGTVSGILAGTGWNLIAGDQVLVYTSSSGARPANTVPTFITAFHMNDNRENGGNHNATTGWSLIASGGSTSHLPPGLTNGVNCMAIHAPTPVSDNEVDNVKYTATLTGNSSDLLAKIYNLTDKNTNWYRHNSTPADITPSGYSPNVTCSTPCTDPDVPTVTYSPTTVCAGSKTTLNISGNLNDATEWKIYTGSCGGTLLGSTATSSFEVTPSSPSTTYYVRGEGGCVTPGSCGQVTVTVTALDDASFAYAASSFCKNASDPSPTITGLTGGSFSSTAGLSIASNGVIDVSASTANTYTVTYTTAGTCPNSSTASVTINNLDDASFAYAASSFCKNASDPSPTITGLTGGSFSSTAGLSIASNGVIDVSASTANTYTVTYTTAGTCPNSSTASVTINNLDDASFAYAASSFCKNASDPSPTITGLTGGSFSSTAGLSIASNGVIDVSASTANTYTVTYTTAGTCPNSSTASVTINNLDDASFAYAASSFCKNASDPSPTITGLTGGSFSSTAGLSIASNGVIDVSASTANTYTVTYTTAGTCPNSSTASVTINNLDDASFAYAASSFCKNASDPSPTITGLTGGSFSSTAGLSIASNGVIDVSASTANTYTVTYTTAGTCPNSSTTSVTINNLDDASFAYAASSFCKNASDPSPTIIGLTGGSFSSTAGLSIASNGVIDVSASTANTYTVTYTTPGTCPNSSTASVTINNLDDASFAYAASSFCKNASDPSPTITGLTGGSFSSTAGLSIASNGVIDVSASTANTYTVTYTTAGTCPNSSTKSVTINNLDDASFAYAASSFCKNASDPSPTITGLTGGSFSSTAGLSIASNGVIDVSASTANTYTVTYTTAGTCPNSSTAPITIVNNPTPEILGSLDFCKGESTTLTADQDYDSYEWSNGSQSKSIEVNVGGSYYLVVVHNGCSGQSQNITISEETCTGILETESASKFHMYPNPVFNGRLFFNKKINNIRVTTLTGKIVLEKGSGSFIDVINLTPGMYILSSNRSNKLFIVK